MAKKYDTKQVHGANRDMAENDLLRDRRKCVFTNSLSQQTGARAKRSNMVGIGIAMEEYVREGRAGSIVSPSFFGKGHRTQEQPCQTYGFVILLWLFFFFLLYLIIFFFL